MGLPGEGVRSTDGHLGAPGIGVTPPPGDCDGDVALLAVVHRRRTWPTRRGDVGDRLDRRVAHLESTHRLVGCGERLGGDPGDLLADVADLVGRQDRPVGERTPVVDVADVDEISRGDDGDDTRDCCGSGGIDADDPRRGDVCCARSGRGAGRPDEDRR